MTYLAVPYSHPDPKVRESRFIAANRAAYRLMKRGDVVFSPISHSHPIEIESGVIGDGDFWARQDDDLLTKSDCVCVLQIDGWEQSAGVGREIRLAHIHAIRIEHLDSSWAAPLSARRSAHDVAVEITGGDRKDDYGAAFDNHRRIASCWTSVIEEKLKAPLTPKEVALMMIGTKIIREAHRHKFDNLVDIHGYAKCIDEDHRFTL